ncbi:MAG TPA: DNA-processing protein DprA [Enhygromyxa sp.]|nr:DNA-processing protein DprA [Enhygromyxa sp.]
MPVRHDPRTWSSKQISSAELGLPGKRQRSFELVGSVPARPRLAIVGSRAAHRRVLRTLGPIVAEAGRRGWSLISGGALGIDGHAHRAALDHGVPQLAVLPCGRDRLYPPGHAELFAALAVTEGSGLLFAQPQGTRPARAMFASRNAIVIGLADAVLVAEAGLRSGSTGTGRLALRRDIPLAAIAGSPGCGALIGAGARPLPSPPHDDTADDRAGLVEAVRVWLDVLSGREIESPRSSSRWPDQLAWLAAALRDAGPSGLSIDTLPDPGAAALALCEAELLGLVCEAAAGRWVAT